MRVPHAWLRSLESARFIVRSAGFAGRRKPVSMIGDLGRLLVASVTVSQACVLADRGNIIADRVG